MARRRRPRNAKGDPGLFHGYRSGLEDNNVQHLKRHKHPVLFEVRKIYYVKPAKLHSYTPDFELKNGIIVETKGIFDIDDRKKHLLIKSQHPDLDLRFVFSRSKTPIRKGSPTTYGDWCDRFGFKYADKLIPVSWLNEPGPGKVITTPRNKLPYVPGDKQEEPSPESTSKRRKAKR